MKRPTQVSRPFRRRNLFVVSVTLAITCFSLKNFIYWKETYPTLRTTLLWPLLSQENQETASEEMTTTTTTNEMTMVVSKTNPPFKFWLFLHDKMTNVIQTTGVYERQETEFIEYVANQCQRHANGGESGERGMTDDGGSQSVWAVDIGANVGFHSLHMVGLGMKVVALEPSPDTSSLLQKSIDENEWSQRIHVVHAAASYRFGRGRLIRHHSSSGMTILQRMDDEEDIIDDDDDREEDPNHVTGLPFGVDEVIAENISLIPVESSIETFILPVEEGDDKRGVKLCLLKVDVEGHELHALSGVNLERYEFQFITFEFFPELLVKAGKIEPYDLLLYMLRMGYECTTHPMYFFETMTPDDNTNYVLSSTDKMKHWYDETVVPRYQQDSGFHINLYCRLR